MSRTLNPWLFLETMPKHLTADQLITLYGGDYAKTPPMKRPIESRKRTSVYRKLILQVLLGLGSTSVAAPTCASRGKFGFAHRTRSYTDLCPQVDRNPYLRLKIGEAMWMLWQTCNQQMLPALNFLVVRRGEKFDIPRGGLFHWWAELYGTSRLYVEFAHAQQKICCDLLDSGELQIVVPPNRILMEYGSLRIARAIRDAVKTGVPETVQALLTTCVPSHAGVDSWRLVFEDCVAILDSGIDCGILCANAGLDWEPLVL